MKKRYDSPITEVVIMDVTQNFLMDSAHGAHHEGFTEGKEMIFLPVLKMEPTTIRLSKRCKQMAKE